MCNVPCVLCDDYEDCEIRNQIIDDDIINLRNFAINMFNFIKNKGLLSEFNEKFCEVLNG